MTDYLLGIEILGQNLKIAVLTPNGKNYKLLSLDRIDRDKLNDWVKTQLPRARSIKAYVTVAESSIYLKKITLPKASTNQIKNAVHWEMRTLSPIPLEQTIYDYKIINSNNKQIEALTLLLKSEIADDISQLLSEAGINPQAIEPSTLALSRIIKIDNKQNTLLLTVENEETNLLVLENGYPTFTTSVTIDLTRDQSSHRRLSEAVIQDLATNTQKILDFWQNRDNKLINQVLITGDISQKYYGLATAIYNTTKIPVFFAKQKNVSLNTKAITKAHIGRYFVAIGAALRVKDKQETLNLLPKNQKDNLVKANKDQHLLNFTLAFAIISFTLLCLSGVIYGAQWFKTQALAKQIRQAKQFTTNHPAQALVPETHQINSEISLIETLMASQKDIGLRLSKIDSLKPGSIDFSTITFSQLKDESFKIEGDGQRDDILAYFDALEASSSAKSVSMPYSNLANKEKNPFELEVLW